ncbi:MAG TPA: hypothetical protein VHZ77_03235 [Gaiellaceae bacterium]|nr:hypothetical protein [Gaiellaceae bacterium]
MNPAGVYFLTACAGALWVSFDARRFDWRGNRLADRVWKWVAGCLFVFGIAFPVYLWERRKAPLLGSAFATSTSTFSSQAVAASGSGAAAIERAAAELAASSPSGWAPEFGTPSYAPAEKPPLLVSPPQTITRQATGGSLGLALLAGAGVALIGGLVWAGVVIATRFDIGFLAWFVGAGTGGVAFRVYGGPIRGAARVAAGLIAAGGILVGKYVIFVHDLNKLLDSVLAGQGPRVGYLSTRTTSLFVHHFGSIVRPVYALWILFAFVAAFLAANPRKRRTARVG